MKSRILCLAIAGALLLALPACQSQPAPPSAVSSSPASSEPTPSPTEPPPASSESLPSSTPPEQDGFTEAWEGNYISKALQADLNIAASPNAISTAYSDCIARWKALIQTAYEDCLAALPELEQGQLETQQSQWAQEMEEKSSTLYDDYPNSEEGQIAAAEALAKLYEDRARTLCEILFRSSGELPSYALEEPIAAG